MYFTPRTYPYEALPDAAPGVLVAGGGPVGLAAALGLARRGVRVTVLEDGDSACSGSRAICLSRHSLEVLDRLGAGEAVSGQALPWTTGRSYYRDTEVLEFTMPHGAGDPHPPMVNISQSAAEQALIDAAAAAPALTIAWRHRVLAVTPGTGEVTVTVATPDGTRELRAPYLVAADGARSAVRESLGLKLRGTSYAGHYLIADIHWKTTLPTERRVWFDPPVSPGQTVIMHRQPDDIWRFDCQLPPDADPAAELAPERVGQLIKTHLDWIGNTEPWTVEWSSVYSARALALDSFTHGRVVFAGDAAHLVPIFGVRGLNSGLEDADTLAWTLALVAAGKGSPALLDAYAHERREAWRQNIASADLSTLFMTPSTDGYRATRDAVLALALARPELRELINPRQSSATHARTSPLTVAGPASAGLAPGDPVPDVRFTAGGRPAVLHAERGADFTLLAFRAAAADALDAAAAALRGQLAPVGVRALIPDDGPETAQALGALPGDVLVIRPDGLLLGRYRAADLDPAALAGLVLAGGTAAGTPADGGVPRALSRPEHAWRLLSDFLDQVPASEREASLTRLALLLALGQPDAATAAETFAQARQA